MSMRRRERRVESTTDLSTLDLAIARMDLYVNRHLRERGGVELTMSGCSVSHGPPGARRAGLHTKGLTS